MTSVWVQTCREQTLPFGGPVATQVQFRFSCCPVPVTTTIAVPEDD